MDTREILRRWHDKQSITDVAQALSCDRKTIRKYIQLAIAKGLSTETSL
jgi:response regulator of citrate/malate metabolism